MRNAAPRTLIGGGLLALGGLLLALAGAYYVYVTFIAGRDAGELTVGTSPGREETLGQPTATPGNSANGPQPGSQALYPGSLLPARQWADPRGTLGTDMPELDGFTPVSDQGRPSFHGTTGRGSRIRIPAINLDASVEELELANLADSNSYSTPDSTVGHIPTTPNPGSHGNGWYFGHLESPVAGEGSVFALLPEIPDLLRDGEDVYVIFESTRGEFLYQVTQTDLLHEDDLSAYQAGDARITLVTCFPRLRYDHRLLVTAKLIGFKHSASA